MAFRDIGCAWSEQTREIPAMIFVSRERHAGCQESCMMRTLVISIPVLLSIGCAGDEPVSDDASRGWRATQLAFADDQTEWQEGVDVDGSLDVSLGCPDGGSYRAVGTFANNETFDLSVEFENCSADGVVIDGSLALYAKVEVDEHGTRVETSYSGELTWSGAAQGSCGIDMTASVVVATSDDSSEVDVEFHGEICGYEADAVVHAGD